MSRTSAVAWLMLGASLCLETACGSDDDGVLQVGTGGVGPTNGGGTPNLEAGRAGSTPNRENAGAAGASAGAPGAGGPAAGNAGAGGSTPAAGAASSNAGATSTGGVVGASAGAAGTDGWIAGAAGTAMSGCTRVDDLAVERLPTIGFDRYHSQLEIETYLAGVATSQSALAEYRILGQSVQGRNLAYLVINATCQSAPPAFFAVGTHHGDERSATEAVLALPDYLLRKSATDPNVRTLLSSFAIYVLPLMNPDGFATLLRGNANGQDLNRDYSFPGRADSGAFAQVETQLVKSLQDSVRFRAAISYHSGALEVLWPWCYT